MTAEARWRQMSIKERLAAAQKIVEKEKLRDRSVIEERDIEL